MPTTDSSPIRKFIVPTARSAPAISRVRSNSQSPGYSRLNRTYRSGRRCSPGLRHLVHHVRRQGGGEGLPVPRTQGVVVVADDLVGAHAGNARPGRRQRHDVARQCHGAMRGSAGSRAVTRRDMSQQSAGRWHGGVHVVCGSRVPGSSGSRRQTSAPRRRTCRQRWVVPQGRRARREDDRRLARRARVRRGQGRGAGPDARQHREVQVERDADRRRLSSTFAAGWWFHQPLETTDELWHAEALRLVTEGDTDRATTCAEHLIERLRKDFVVACIAQQARDFRAAIAGFTLIQATGTSAPRRCSGAGSCWHRPSSGTRPR